MNRATLRPAVLQTALRSDWPARIDELMDAAESARIADYALSEALATLWNEQQE